MGLYFSIYILFVIFSFVVENKLNRTIYNQTSTNGYRTLSSRNTYFLNLLFVMVLLLAIFRYGIGSDYILYLKNYEGLAVYSWEKVDVRLIFKAISDLFHVFHLPFQWFVALFSIFSLTLFQIVIKRHSWDQFLSYAVLIGLSYYSFGLSGFRQFSAIMAILFAAHIYSVEKDTKKTTLPVIFFFVIAIGLHLSSLFGCLLLVVAIAWKPKTKTVTMINTMSIIILTVTYFFLDKINALLLQMISHLGFYSSYANYANVEEQYYRLFSKSGISLFNLLLLAPSLYFCYRIFRDVNRKSYECDSFNYIMVKLYYFWQVILCFNMDSEMVNRLLMYISISSVFVYPQILKYIYAKYGKKTMLIGWVFIVSAVGFMFFRALSSNIYEVIPYKSIFY